ncbi:phospholipase D-like domain-containing protein [Oligoflexus tunisiensis]|uniref:phospholipase D-like domain-containing protein n=1 Tax=Oligoflexus tunisiensis TaxID=708132 RepID=UPI00114D2A84|nr:phosphatidylserine/phosphatidylglycerophosphate/cardiolipin synthase family protein [Oligoflexus tunisiensis]
MRSLYCGLFISLLVPLSCKTVRPVAVELNSLQTNCQEPITLQSWLKPDTSCTADGFYPGPEEARKRDQSPWIPCNDVEWINDTQDLFGPGAGNDADTLALSTYHRIYRDWLGKADRFTPDMAGKVFQNFDQPLPFNQDNPILESAMASTLKDLIRGAQHNIVMDIFMLGGSWGADILHDLGAAADRGVEVVLLHDNVSKFSVGNEMDPLWQAAKQFSLKHPRFVALDANIRPPQRASSLPVGLEKLGGTLSGLMDLITSVDGKSDHSKIMIIDGLYTKSPDEYANLKPHVLVTSRNLVDSAGSFYPDQGVVIRGPAAVVTLLHYQSDLFWAADQAKKTKRLNADDEKLLQSVQQRLETLRTTPTLIKGQGWVSVQPLQVSANDEIRNLDTSIIPQIMAAERSIDIHGRVAYNWPLAMALKEAMARGVKVRIILDQQTRLSALGNAVLPYMLAEAPRRLVDGRESKQLVDDSGRIIKESELPIKWFLPLHPSQKFGRSDRSDLVQALNAKTIIIDGRLALFGSADLDALTWAGGFREYAVWVDDPALASESARQFDRLWNHDFLTVSHKVWLGEAEPSAEVVRYLKARQEAAGCDPQAEACQPGFILQGGKAFPAKAPQRNVLKNILAADADRLRLLIPAKVVQDELGRPKCRKL